jgi:arabinofuranan 3-O-arabinosyltransferase
VTRAAVGRWISVLTLLALAYLPALGSSRGAMPADTKLYLYLNPGRLIGDAPLTWDSGQFAGWVPHQIIAYVWPQGPWYWTFDRLGVPDWVAHRLWIGTLLAAGAFGVRWLARRFGLGIVGSFVAACAYMLSPYVLPYISRTSAMLLPWAALGWLMALTDRAARLPTTGRRRDRWRDPALIALIIATVGAPNATALLMIAPGPLLVLLHARHQRVLSWRNLAATTGRISVLAVGVSLWWMAMLVIQGRYGADLLGYSESLEAVSYTSTAPEVLRGLGYWLFYVRDAYAFTTTASIPYAESTRLIFWGTLLLIGGLCGLTFTNWRHRRLAALLVAVGTLVAVGAHPLENPPPLLAPFTDSGLSLALRSSTRAVPLVSLGIALGLGAMVAAIPRRSGVRVAAGGLVVWLVLANMPSTTNRAYVDPALQRAQSAPAEWLAAAAALDDSTPQHRVLQLPGQEFGAFSWGYTVDPPLPGLTDAPLITRDLLPLGSPAAMDLLYAFDNRVQSGTVDPNSVAAVARLFGADTVWITNDADFERFRTPRPDTFSALIRGAAGLTAAQAFGEPRQPPSSAVDEAAIVDDVSGGSEPATVELYDVENAVPVARTAERTVAIVGSGDGVVDAAEAGLIDGSEALFYTASSPGGGPDTFDALIITDSNRQRAMHWRGSQDTTGMTEGIAGGVLEADDGDQRLPVFPAAGPDSYSTAEFDGEVEVASSSYGERFAYRPEQRAAMAVDGDVHTAWEVADRSDPIGEYITVSTTDGSLQLLQPQRAANRMITAIEIAGPNGSSRVALDASSLTEPGQRVPVPADVPLRVTIAEVASRPGGTDTGASSVGFAELGPQATEWVRTPDYDVAGDIPTAVVLTRERTDPLDRWRADPEPVLRRVVAIPDNDYELTVTARLDARAADEVIADFVGLDDVATSTRRLTGSLTATGWMATDGNPSTQWTSAFHAVTGSTLEIPLTPGVPLGSVTISQPTGDLYSTITSIEVAVDGGIPQRFDVRPDDSGRVTVDLGDVSGTRASFTIVTIEARSTIDRRYAEPTTLPVAIEEITSSAIPGLPAQVDSNETCVDLVTIDGAQVSFRLDAAQRTELVGGASVELVPCDAATFRLGGEERIASVDGVLQVDRIVMKSGDVSTDVHTSATVSVSGSGSARTLTVEPCPEGCWLVFGEGFNEGWSATVDGVPAPGPQLISGGFNGWWLAPSDDTTTVQLRFAPQRTLNVALLLSSLTVAACIVLVAVCGWHRPRRLLGDLAPIHAGLDALRIAGRRDTIVSAAAVVATGVLLVSPVYGVVLALPLAVTVLITRRPVWMMAAAIGAVAFTMGTVIIRQRSHRWFANAAWPRRFEDLHRPAVLAVCLLLAGALALRPAGHDDDPA